MKTKEDSSLSASQQTIIQCPSCQTKFSVEASAISQLDFPRFHCSRCDNVFGLDESSKFKPQVVEEPVEKIFDSQQEKDFAQSQESADDNLEPPAYETESLPDEFEDLAYDKEFVEEDEAAPSHQPVATQSETYSPVEPIITARITTPEHASESAPTTSLYRGLEIPTQYDKTIQAAAPRETEEVVETPPSLTRREKHKDPLKDQMELQFSSTHFSKPTASTEESTGSSNANLYKSIAETLARERAEVYSAKASARKEEKVAASSSGIGSIAKITAPSTDADYPKLFDNAFLAENEANRFAFAGGRISSSTLFFMAPIVCALVCLAVLGSYLKNNVNAGASFASLLFSPPAKVAPAGLIIKNPKYRKLTLESGEDVRLISGTLVNSSPESFRDVKLEGLAFDDAGHPLTKVKVDASSSLSKTRVKSLSVDMIKNMQSAAATKRYELKPGDSQDFEMALVDDASVRARYFSARIYSVK
jgi:predicted Zn finger-like uncharacterized protein